MSTSADKLRETAAELLDIADHLDGGVDGDPVASFEEKAKATDKSPKQLYKLVKKKNLAEIIAMIESGEIVRPGRDPDGFNEYQKDELYARSLRSQAGAYARAQLDQWAEENGTTGDAVRRRLYDQAHKQGIK